MRLQQQSASIRAEVQDLIDPPDAHTRDIRLEQLKLAARTTDASLAKLPPMATVIAGALALWSPWLPLAIWWAVLIGYSFWMKRQLRPYLTGEARPADLKWLTIRFFSINLVQMTIFSLVAPIGWPIDEPMGQALVMLITAGTMASVASITGPSRPIFISDMIPVCLAAVLTPLLLSGWAGVPSAGLAMLFAFLMYDNANGAYLLAENALKLNDQNEALIARLRAADRAKSDFFANMSHELRTPLNAILGFSEVMKDEMIGPIGNSKYRSYAGDIHASGQHLLGLVNDILDLAKIEAGRIELSDDVLSLGGIIDSSVSLFRIQADRAGISLIKDLGEDVDLCWDLRAARQIVMNLMSNALKFTPAGGSITISARRSGDGGALITFRDTGCGIDPALHAKIFEPFGQGRHELSAQHAGTGLGLAIVKGLVEAHGGRLALESEIGRGAAFTIVVPPERVLPAEPSRAAA
jgi:two-component system cell cycle sensor histidine kinase PleC